VKDKQHDSTEAEPTHSHRNAAITAGGNFNDLTNTGGEQAVCEHESIKNDSSFHKDTQYNTTPTAPTCGH
jgi:hypothetical protein